MAGPEPHATAAIQGLWEIFLRDPRAGQTQGQAKRSAEPPRPWERRQRGSRGQASPGRPRLQLEGGQGQWRAAWSQATAPDPLALGVSSPSSAPHSSLEGGPGVAATGGRWREGLPPGAASISWSGPSLPSLARGAALMCGEH